MPVRSAQKAFKDVAETSPFFVGVDATAFWTHYANFMQLQSTYSGAFLTHKDAPARNTFFVLNGTAIEIIDDPKLSISPRIRSLITSFYRTGSLVGLEYIFEASATSSRTQPPLLMLGVDTEDLLNPVYAFDVKTLKPATVLAIPIQVFEDAFQNPDFAQLQLNALKLFCEKFVATQDMLYRLAFRSDKYMTVYCLINFAEALGTVLEDNSILIRGLTVTQLAEISNVSREYCSQILGNLLKKGLIHRLDSNLKPAKEQAQSGNIQIPDMDALKLVLEEM